MNKTKLILLGIAVFIVTGAVLASKTKKFGAVIYQTDTEGSSFCRVTLVNYTLQFAGAPLTGKFATLPGPCTTTKAYQLN